MSDEDISQQQAKSRVRNTLIFTGLALALVGTVTLAIALGPGHVSFPTALRIMISRIPLVGRLIHENWSTVQETIIISVRLPRILTAGLVGAALAVAGCAMQGLFRNPMADPYILGVSSGAAFGASLVIVLGIGLGGFATSGIAFAFASVAVTIAYFVSSTKGRVAVETLLLAGVAVAALFSALVSFMNFIAGDKLTTIVFWTMGGFWNTNWNKFLIALGLIVPGVLVVLLYGKDLNLMLLGDQTATDLGVNVERTKKVLLAVSALITAAAVSVSGVIGFVGLIIPHIVRNLVGPDHKILVPSSCLVGAMFLILADTVARTAIAPTELPVGLITALCGAPFFLYLLRRRKRIMGW